MMFILYISVVIMYRTLSSIVRTFFKQNYDEVLSTRFRVSRFLLLFPWFFLFYIFWIIPTINWTFLMFFYHSNGTIPINRGNDPTIYAIR